MILTDKGRLLHANALKLERYGILIMGASGTGKSLVTLTLIERAPIIGRSAILISDDHVLLHLEANSIHAHAPETIHGGLEIRGAGLFSMPYQSQTRIDLVVELKGYGERFPSGCHFNYLGTETPMLKLPESSKADTISICHAIEAHLFRPRWISEQKK